ncbi:MAG TPA: FG-GAP-like repeat-containing protein [Verrucomicrobiae bacterium]|nr:FG-GAP-like repeat-containing protein [Verrucomicrobiae bacterium]
MLRRRDSYCRQLSSCVAALLLTTAHCLTAEPGHVTTAALPVTGNTTAGFTMIPPSQIGITFSNVVARRSIHTLIANGLAAGDVDGDGWCDLYFCSSDGTNALYRNLGNWKFDDITAKADVACSGQQSIGATLADVNGDGSLDLIVTARGGPNRLLLNDGKGRFTEDLSFPGRTSRLASTSIAVADVNGDGAVDIYICNYTTSSYLDTHLEIGPELSKEWQRVREGKELSPQFTNQFYVQDGSMHEKGEPDVLLLNDGRGRFKPADVSCFTLPPGSLQPGPLDGSGLAAQFRDINGDGSPDLYVCNDFQTPDRFWLNDGQGRFALAPANTVRHTSSSSMVVDFADINLDGWLDFFVGDMLSRDHSRRMRQRGLLQLTSPQINSYSVQPQYPQNTFYLNRGDNTFAEIAPFAGLAASEWTWGANFLDIDFDGYPDLLISCGNLQDLLDADAQIANAARVQTMQDMENFRRNLPVLKVRCQLFRNQGDLRFEEVSERYGFHAERPHGGMIVTDLDNDGDLDVVINNADGMPELYRNDGTAPRIAVRLRGRSPNTSGIGAKVKLIGQKTQEQEVISGGRYASGGDYTLAFAARPDWSPYKLQVTWREGRVTEVPDVQANQFYVITEMNTISATPRVVNKPNPLFEDVSTLLNHTNQENAFNDFEAQPLLPNRLSRLGPGVSWFDINGDGLDELFIGSSAGGSMGMFRNLGDGRFQPLNAADKQINSRRDQTSVLGFGAPSNGVTILIGASSWEEPEAKMALYVLKRKPNGDWEMGPQVQHARNATGPLALADVNGDGNLDVFVGGRARFGRYPEPADSMLLLRDGQGRLTDAGPMAAGALNNLGMVSSAVFADFSGDGRPDLIAACEWGAIQILINTPNGFTNVTSAWGLDQFTGWWNGVATGDFDGDGRLDIVASNWGQNTKYEDTYDAQRPLRIYYGDFNEMGRIEIIEAHQDRVTRKWVPERDLTASAAAVPYLRGNTPTFQAFGEADLTRIYGDRLTNAAVVEARELRHLLFLNRGGRFEPVPFPPEAQLAPAFGVTAADFDGDGNDDVFLAQNFFSAQPETLRNDAGRGLLLLGNGKGGLRPLSAEESGIAIYGEQRGCAVSDYDADGRVDLVVAQSNNQTRLLHNRRSRPGLRVQLEGGPGNPQCVGAMIRAVTATGPGRAQLITAGSGYWSQDSSVLVITSVTPITGLQVRWPDGSTREYPVPPTSPSLTLRPPDR